MKVNDIYTVDFGTFLAEITCEAGTEDVISVHIPLLGGGVNVGKITGVVSTPVGYLRSDQVTRPIQPASGFAKAKMGKFLRLNLGWEKTKNVLENIDAQFQD